MFDEDGYAANDASDEHDSSSTRQDLATEVNSILEEQVAEIRIEEETKRARQNGSASNLQICIIMK